jgi:subtilisin-like proprotein convertase family protein
VSDNDVNYHFGSDTAEGLTPGFWKQNADQFDGTQWPRDVSGDLIYGLTTKVGEVFDVPVDSDGAPVYPIAFSTLTEALDFNGGDVFALMRHAVAALLNATHLQVAYPLTPADIVTRTNAALASGDAQQIEALKDEFDAFNNIGGDLNQQVARVNASDASASEDGASVFVTLELSNAQTGPVSISYQTVDGTATAGEDYVATTGTVVFEAGQTSRQVEILLSGDLVYEGTENFFLDLIAPVGVQIGRNPAQITLSDNDAAPTFAITATDSLDAEELTDPATFTVTRSANSNDASDYTVSVATGGTWNAVSGLLTLTDGIDTAIFTVTPVDDGEDETDESVVLTLSNPVGANLGGSTQATATIVDNDDPPVATTNEYGNDIPIDIPDQSTIESTIVVGDAYDIQDINVVLNIAHTRAADLDVFLISPSGTRIELFTDVGGNSDNFTGTELDDAAGTSITSGAAPFTGFFRPEGDLGLLEGETVNGTWTLEVTDDQNRQTGTLVSWSLVVTESVLLEAASVAEASGNDVVLLTRQELDPIVDEAVRRWTKSGLLDTAQLVSIETIETIEFEIRNLAGTTLGLTTADTIVIDTDAAGYGWYVDMTPSDDLEFSTTTDDGRQLAAAGSDAAGHMDLLTAVMHEVGHFLGLEHSDSGDNWGVMEAVLDVGERTSLNAIISQETTSAETFFGQAEATRIVTKMVPDMQLVRGDSDRFWGPDLRKKSDLTIQVTSNKWWLSR